MHASITRILSYYKWLTLKPKKEEYDLMSATKLDLYLELNENEPSLHLTVAGSPAWFSTGILPTSACISSIALQGRRKRFSLLNSCRHAYAQIQLHELSALRNVLLDYRTVDICVFSNDSSQNLSDKISKIAFIFVLSDGNDHCKIYR